MEKRELVRDMKSYCDGGSFITKSKLAGYMGIKDARNVNAYLRGLERVRGKYYFIADVATRLIELRVL